MERKKMSIEEREAELKKLYPGATVRVEPHIEPNPGPRYVRTRMKSRAKRKGRMG